MKKCERFRALAFLLQTESSRQAIIVSIFPFGVFEFYVDTYESGNRGVVDFSLNLFFQGRSAQRLRLLRSGRDSQRCLYSCISSWLTIFLPTCPTFLWSSFFCVFFRSNCPEFIFVVFHVLTFRCDIGRRIPLTRSRLEIFSTYTALDLYSAVAKDTKARHPSTSLVA